MRTRYRIGIIGVLFLLMCGPALAHGPAGHAAYRDSGWSGAVTVWGGSGGHSGWSGALNYNWGAPYGYAPGYVPWAGAHRHGPYCGHAPGRGYAKAYRKGYRHGHGHSHGPVHRRGKHH
jgi:hypothetical protein